MSDEPQDQPLDGEVLDAPVQTVAKHPAPYSKQDPDELTFKQITFAQAVIAGKSLSDSYKAAYDCSKMNPKTIYTRGWQLRHNHDKVKAFIDAAKASLASKISIDKSYVLEALHHSAETALARKTMKLRKVINGEVVDVEAHYPDRGAANRALELLGKEAGMFVDRREVGTPGEFARHDEAELANMLLQTLQAMDTGD